MDAYLKKTISKFLPMLFIVYYKRQAYDIPKTAPDAGRFNIERLEAIS